MLAPLIVAIFAMGIFPNFFFDKLEPSVNRFLARSGVQAVPTAVTQKAPSRNGSRLDSIKGH